VYEGKSHTRYIKTADAHQEAGRFSGHKEPGKLSGHRAVEGQKRNLKKQRMPIRRPEGFRDTKSPENLPDVGQLRGRSGT
jgi:hypothetical protein